MDPFCLQRWNCVFLSLTNLRYFRVLGASLQLLQLLEQENFSQYFQSVSVLSVLSSLPLDHLWTEMLLQAEVMQAVASGCRLDFDPPDLRTLRGQSQNALSF